MGHSNSIRQRVTAIVPARNEQAVIAACVNSLAPQEEIAEILVIDDQSSDRTAEIVREIAAQVPKVRLLQTGELPTGWVGKNNAVWIGARESRGEWLLFTDADAVHSAGSVAKALSIAGEQGAALVSFSPEQVMGSWYEKALIPYVYGRLARRFRFDEVNDPENRSAAANGQFILIRRDVYERVGGHASIAGNLLEDVALASRVKSAGERIWFGSGKGLVRVRMYRTFAAMWEGWKKNLSSLMGGSTGAVQSEVAKAVLPILAAVLATILFLDFPDSPLLAGLAAGVFLGIFLFDFKALRKNGYPGGLVLYSIPGRLLFAALLWASLRGHRRGRLEWKGRAYPADTPGASKG